MEPRFTVIKKRPKVVNSFGRWGGVGVATPKNPRFCQFLIILAKLARFVLLNSLYFLSHGLADALHPEVHGDVVLNLCAS